MQPLHLPAIAIPTDNGWFQPPDKLLFAPTRQCMLLLQDTPCYD